MPALDPQQECAESAEKECRHKVQKRTVNLCFIHDRKHPE